MQPPTLQQLTNVIISVAQIKTQKDKWVLYIIKFEDIPDEYKYFKYPGQADPYPGMLCQSVEWQQEDKNNYSDRMIKKIYSDQTQTPTANNGGSGSESLVATTIVTQLALRLHTETGAIDSKALKKLIDETFEPISRGIRYLKTLKGAK
ncbi:MAG: hypothetical protein GY820_38600 [Gammaproteobacteria bacterium]|nr:hypothetical protein [Gammaproteobacteria bacterium]